MEGILRKKKATEAESDINSVHVVRFTFTLHVATFSASPSLSRARARRCITVVDYLEPLVDDGVQFQVHS